MRLPFGFVLTRPKPRTATHPDLKKSICFAFECGGKEFYEFKNQLDMPIERFQQLNEFIRETELRLTRKDLEEYLEIIEKSIDAGKLTYVAQMIHSIRARLNQFLETDTFYRLFSCAFFTLDEDITGYDWEINTEKIELFKNEKPDTFFFKKPLREYLPPVDISQSDLQTFLKMSEVSRKLMHETSSVILKNLEEDGKSSSG